MQKTLNLVIAIYSLQIFVPMYIAVLVTSVIVATSVSEDFGAFRRLISPGTHGLPGYLAQTSYAWSARHVGNPTSTRDVRAVRVGLAYHGL